MTSTVKSIQFGVLSQDAIEGLSAVNVVDYTLHHRATGRHDGLLDTRFGAIDRFHPCGTCGKTITQCPSHPGHIVLPMPLPHVKFKGIIQQLLNCICCNCSKLVATPSQMSALAAMDDPTKRLTRLFTVLRAKKQRGTVVVCRNTECGWPQPTTVLSEPYFMQKWDTEAIENDVQGFDTDVAYGQSFNNWDVIYLLKSIPSADLEFLGFNAERSHPADMMLRQLIVPGVAVRPTLHQSDGSKRQTYNELTKVLACIVKYVSQLKTAMDTTGFKPETMDNNLLTSPLSTASVAMVRPSMLASSKGRGPGPGWTNDIDCQIKALYANISAYMYPKLADIPGFRMRPYDAKLHALKNSNLIAPLQGGKFGRYRQHLMGKRVNFCIRTVVTPFPEGDADQIGVPKCLAQIVTVPVRVTRYNIDLMHAKLRAGSVKHIITDPENNGDELIEVNSSNQSHLTLKIGFVVERFLENDDYVIVNRQPTLHRSSIMAHRVVIVDGKTVRLNMGVSTPYNCDCDGDELNLHVCQSVEATAELEELMSVHNNIMHPGANKPLFGLIQDDIAAIYLLTSPDTWFTRSEFCNLLMQACYDPNSDPTAGMKDAKLREWSTHHLPQPAIIRASCRNGTSGGPLWSGKQVVSAILMTSLNFYRSGAVVGSGGGGGGDKKDEIVISHGQLLVGQLCKKTMGTVPHSLMHYIALYNGYGAACRFLSDLQRITSHAFARTGFSMGVDDCFPMASAQPKLDNMVGEIFDHLTNVSRKVDEMRVMAGSDKAKHDHIDTVQDIAIVDTVKTALNTAGTIIAAELPRGNAVKLMTCDASSKGSVFNAAQIMGCLGQTFVDGNRPGQGSPRFLPSSEPLLPQPSSSSSSRAAITTSKIKRDMRSRGFISRCYASGLALEEVITHSMGGREGLIDTANKTRKTGYLQRRLVKGMETLTVAYDNTVRNSRGSIMTLLSGGDGYEATRVFQLSRLELLLLSNAELQAIYDKKRAEQQIFSLQNMLAVRDMMRQCHMHGLHSDILTQHVTVMSPFNLEMLIPPEASVVSHRCRCYDQCDNLHPHLRQRVRDFVVTHLHLPVACHVMYFLEARANYCNMCLEWLLEEMQRLHRLAQVQPGECIGALTATSLGEPSTQLTLNTFHLAGVANAGMTYGIPRLCELVDGTARMKSPCVIIPLVAGTEYVQAKEIAASLAEVMLIAKIETSEICNGVPTSVRESNQAFFAIYNNSEPRSSLLEFSLRIVLTPDINLSFIVTRLQQAVGSLAFVLTDAKALVPTVQIVVVRDAKVFAMALKRATTARTTKVNKKSFRPLQLPPGTTASDLDSPTSVPMSIVCGALSDGFATVRQVLEANIVRELRARLLSTCTIQGHRGITAASVRTMRWTRVCDEGTGKLINEDRFFLDVRGTGLRSVAAIPQADIRLVISNNVNEVYATLGIDAAAQVLFYEIRTCFEVGGTRTDDRLISLLVDVITHWGFILPMTRHGINRLRDQSVIAKITFEEVADMLFSAASTGQSDPLLGPSEAIMVGKPIIGGTGMATIVSESDSLTRDEATDNLVVVSVLPECPSFIPPQVQLAPLSPTALHAHAHTTFNVPVTTDEQTFGLCSQTEEKQTRRRRLFRPSSPEAEQDDYDTDFNFDLELNKPKRVCFRPSSPL